MTKANLSKTYNPKDFEQRLYQEWMDKGYFKSSPKIGRASCRERV